MVNALWEQFSFRLWPTSLQSSAAAEIGRADDKEKGACNCKVAKGVWKSAVYIGPGGPLLRDR